MLSWLNGPKLKPCRSWHMATPDTRGKKTTLDLPGRLEAYSQAQIYARVTGYLKEWRVDIGATVKAGQVLAEVDAPDLDQQIMQAEADLTSTQANSVLSNANLERGQSLITSGSVSKQDLEQRTRGSGPASKGLVKIVESQRRPHAGAGEIQEHHGAVRWTCHVACNGYRRSDQCGRRRQFLCFVIF